MPFRRGARVLVVAVVLTGVVPGLASAQAAPEPYYEFLMARHLEAEDDRAGALAALTRAATADPAAAEIHAEVAMLLYSDQAFDRAEEAARRALAIDSECLEANRVLGLLYANKAQNEAGAVQRALYVNDAITHFERVAAQSSDLRVVSILGQLYLEAGQVDKAVERLTEAVSQNPFSIEARRLLALAYATVSDYDSAIASLQDLAEQEPRVYVLIGQYQYDAERYAEAAESFTRALAVQPRSLELKQKRIDALQQAGQYDRAASFAADAQRQHPDESSFARMQAQALYRGGQESGAIEVLRDSLKTFPRDPDVMNHLGYLLALSGRDLDEAIRLVTRALEARPNTAAYLDSLGWAHFRRGDLGDAEKYLGAAAAQLPGNSEIMDHLGDVHAARGNWTEAIEAWSRALAGDGDGIDTAAVAKKIEDARARPD